MKKQVKLGVVGLGRGAIVKDIFGEESIRLTAICDRNPEILEKVSKEFTEKVGPLETYDNFEDFLSKHPDTSIYFFSTKAPRSYTEVDYCEENVYLMFGKETRGLPEELLYAHPDRCVRIPMRDKLRSLNLSNSVAIAVYEVLRQQDFEGLREDGELTQFSWSEG